MSCSKKGDRGKRGHRGHRGCKGCKGDAGNAGVAGVTGPTGPCCGGNTGPKGDTGSQGLKGDTGLQGIQGIQGDTGSQGAKGDTGLQGIQGIQGDTGLQGIQGIQGIQGDTGLQGVQGVTGSQGATGSQGLKGDTGSSGVGQLAYLYPGGGSVQLIGPGVTFYTIKFRSPPIFATGWTETGSTGSGTSLYRCNVTGTYQVTLTVPFNVSANAIKPGVTGATGTTGTAYSIRIFGVNNGVAITTSIVPLGFSVIPSITDATSYVVSTSFINNYFATNIASFAMDSPGSDLSGIQILSGPQVVMNRIA